MFISAKKPITCQGPLGWDCQGGDESILELADNHGDHIKKDSLSKMDMEIKKDSLSKMDMEIAPKGNIC